MIDSIRNYIATCPYLKEFVEINVDYLKDKVVAYSVNPSVGFNPVVSEDIIGNQTRQFLFTFDSKFYWNSEVQNNVDNSKFYEDFSNWLDNNNKKGIFPTLGVGETPIKIEALTNGYIFATNSDEALYRIQCKLTYYKEVLNESKN